jgi:MoxR-like ATPase
MAASSVMASVLAPITICGLVTPAVNAASTLQRPLLVKGEPGTGKTMLAEEVAAALGMPLMQWHIKSTTKAQQGLYEYDAVSRLRDSQLGDELVVLPVLKRLLTQLLNCGKKSPTSLCRNGIISSKFTVTTVPLII